MFDTFEHVQRRSARSLLASFLVHIATVIAIVTVPVFFAGPALELNLSTATEIVFPLRASVSPLSPPRAERPVAAEVERLRQPPPSSPEAVPVERTALVRPTQPRIEPPLAEAPKLLIASPDLPRPDAAPALEQVAPAAEPTTETPQIELGGFAGASLAKRTPNEVAAAQAVDSFGAVKPDRQGARWRTTSYEHSGFSEATGGNRRSPKDVAAAENTQSGSSFGSATVAKPPYGATGTIHTGFGQAVAGKRQIEVERAVEPASATSAARVLAKPLPQYTDQARRLRIEGDVRLRVNFRADATVEVLQVIEGLGHGLDESAVRAASQIEFAPAERGGKPVDFIADVFIRFRLAY